MVYYGILVGTLSTCESAESPNRRWLAMPYYRQHLDGSSKESAEDKKIQKKNLWVKTTFINPTFSGHFLEKKLVPFPQR